MSITIQQIILDAKRIANRLKDRELLGDSLIIDTESVNKQIESMRTFSDDIEALNKLARDKSNAQLINIIHQENPQIREIQQENRELRACLEDHQRALEHIMSKYREHTQKEIFRTKINFTDVYKSRENDLIRKQAEKIKEMAAVMQRAATVDEDKINREHEYLSKLVTENKGLRELLQISQKFGSSDHKFDCEDKCIQTEDIDNENLIVINTKEEILEKGDTEENIKDMDSKIIES